MIGVLERIEPLVLQAIRGSKKPDTDHCVVTFPRWNRAAAHATYQRQLRAALRQLALRECP